MLPKPRIHDPGTLYHVMLRGNGVADIFLDDQDRAKFLLLLQQILEKLSFRVLAFCLMDNHIHLALQVSDIPLSRVMQQTSRPDPTTCTGVCLVGMNRR